MLHTSTADLDAYSVRCLPILETSDSSCAVSDGSPFIATIFTH